MSDSFDFISTEDKPALIAFSTPEWLETAKAALAGFPDNEWRRSLEALADFSVSRPA